ncbi:DNA cytosine methyltransferase [Streptomyces sp. 891-h]|nr:DNA cytosine methyltransferase [Streptomyces sp. 891-h]
MAVCDVLGASVAWHCQYDPDDRHQYAARILAQHWPEVPNHGDITAVDWSAVEPVDILTAGFPCQDVSLAGLRAGIAEGTRSGLWAHVARAISALRPRLVVIENVPGLLSSPAARGVGPDGTPLDEGGTAGTLRALGAVLGDLAGIGFDAEWAVVPASAVLAPHQRKRVFLLAWPAADPDDERGERAGSAGREPERHASGEGREPAHAQGEGQQGRRIRGRAPGRRPVAQDPDDEPRDERREPAPGQAPGGRARADARGRSRAPATDTASVGRSEGRRVPDGSDGTTRTGREGESSRDCAQRVPGKAVEWGQYGPAIARWEAVTGRPAPRPTDDRGRLTPGVVEWMMGLPAGHVTAVPGLTRPAQLKALGNGVVPPQAAHAIRYLLHRAGIAARLGVAA